MVDAGDVAVERFIANGCGGCGRAIGKWALGVRKGVFTFCPVGIFVRNGADDDPVGVQIRAARRVPRTVA